MDSSDKKYAYLRINRNGYVRFNLITPEQFIIEYRPISGDDFSKIVRETFGNLYLETVLKHPSLLIKLVEVK